MRSAWISAACRAATASSKREDCADCSANDHRRATSDSATWRGTTDTVDGDDNGEPFLRGSGATNSTPTRIRASATASTNSNSSKTSQKTRLPTAAIPLPNHESPLNVEEESVACDSAF